MRRFVNVAITWEASFRCCLARQVICKDVAAEGKLNFFWTLRLVADGIEHPAFGEKGLISATVSQNSIFSCFTSYFTKI